MPKRGKSEGCELDMTPMIDIVFQLIIFFVVTIKLEKDVKADIKLEMAKDSPVIKEEDPRRMVVEVDRRGRISMHGAALTAKQFRSFVKIRFDRLGEFPVLIRGDYRTKHEHIRVVMDICAGIGIPYINFVAIKEKREE